LTRSLTAADLVKPIVKTRRREARTRMGIQSSLSACVLPDDSTENWDSGYQGRGENVAARFCMCGVGF
jgi:hypothetical protein